MCDNKNIGVIDMTNEEKIRELLKSSQNGIITTEQLTSLGLHRSGIQKLVKNGEIYKYARGVYIRADAWEDDFYGRDKKRLEWLGSHGCWHIGNARWYVWLLRKTTQRA